MKNNDKPKIKKLVIFDFDGTLADSFSKIVETFNDLAREYNLHQVKPEEIPALRKISSRELLKKFGFPTWRLPFLLQKGKRMLRKKVMSVHLFDGIEKTVKELKKEGHVLGILSSNSRANVKKIIENSKINVFDFVHISSNLFGKSRMLNKIIKKYGYDKKDVYYVGDETRDIEAARECGIKMIAVSWGFNDRGILKKYKPDYLINKPEELLKIIL